MKKMRSIQAQMTMFLLLLSHVQYVELINKGKIVRHIDQICALCGIMRNFIEIQKQQ